MVFLVNVKSNTNNNIFYEFLTGFIRIRGVFNWSAISFMGFILGCSSLNVSSYVKPLSIFMLTTFCITSFTFGINNYHDIESDRKNPRRKNMNIMASGILSKKTGLMINLMLMIIPLAISLLFKIEIFLLCGVLLFWMWIYSAPPFRLKGRPVIDVLWHFCAFVLLIVWGSYIAGSVAMITILIAVSFGIFSCIAQVDNHIKDYAYDKKTGTVTYAVWVGIDKAKKTLQGIFILHIIFLIPLVLLYSLNYLYSIVIMLGGILGGCLLTKIQKETILSPIYHFIIVFGLFVYLSCIVYHFSVLFNVQNIQIVL
jgi:4-hydroxybenzoate polyprenyltransferase